MTFLAAKTHPREATTDVTVYAEIAIASLLIGGILAFMCRKKEEKAAKGDQIAESLFDESVCRN